MKNTSEHFVPHGGFAIQNTVEPRLSGLVGT